MKNVYIHTRPALSRRAVLRGGSVALGLPLLDAMTPAFARRTPGPRAHRFVGFSLSLGLHNPNLVPENAGTSLSFLLRA
ncbi:MAG: hypothetical protein AAF492_19550, partial [Verrucomicrobiota bacterium]